MRHLTLDQRGARFSTTLGVSRVAALAATAVSARAPEPSDTAIIEVDGYAGESLAEALVAAGDDGVALDIGSTLVLGRDDFPVPGEVLTEESQGHGIVVRRASQLVGAAIMPIISRANAGAGFHVVGATASIVGSSLEANDGPGLDLGFGAHATAVDDVMCDESVLLRGALSCPAP